MMDQWSLVPDETPIDPSDIKVKVQTRAELNRAELRSIRPSIKKYLDGKLLPSSAPFDFHWCLKLHAKMFGKVFRSAGKIRNCELNFGVPAVSIANSLAEMLENLHAWQDYGMGLAEQAARLHHSAVRIHPFKNGNGRWSRMLANIWVKRQGHPITIWPDEIVGTRSKLRDDYISAIKNADEGDFEALIELHKRYEERRLVD